MNILWEFHWRKIWSFRVSRNTRIWSNNITCMFSLCNNLLELRGDGLFALAPVITYFLYALCWVWKLGQLSQSQYYKGRNWGTGKLMTWLVKWFVIGRAKIFQIPKSPNLNIYWFKPWLLMHTIHYFKGAFAGHLLCIRPCSRCHRDNDK